MALANIARFGLIYVHRHFICGNILCISPPRIRPSLSEKPGGIRGGAAMTVTENSKSSLAAFPGVEREERGAQNFAHHALISDETLQIVGGTTLRCALF